MIGGQIGGHIVQRPRFLVLLALNFVFYSHLLLYMLYVLCNSVVKTQLLKTVYDKVKLPNSVYNVLFNRYRQNL